MSQQQSRTSMGAKGPAKRPNDMAHQQHPQRQGSSSEYSQLDETQDQIDMAHQQRPQRQGRSSEYSQLDQTQDQNEITIQDHDEDQDQNNNPDETPSGLIFLPDSIQFKGRYYTGWVQIVCGLVPIIIGVATVVHIIANDYSEQSRTYVFGFITFPIWGGVLYIAAGSLGAASYRANKSGISLVVPYLVISILAVCVAIAQAVWEGLAVSDRSCDEENATYNCQTDQAKAQKGLHALTSSMAVLEVAAGILGSVYCCLETRCSCRIPSDNPSKAKKHERRRQTSGLAQVVCGVVSMFFGISITVLSSTTPPLIESTRIGNLPFSSGILSWPIWGGAIYNIAGSLGAASETAYLICHYMVMCVVSAMCALGQATWEALSADKSCDLSDATCETGTVPQITGTALHACTSFTAVVEIIAAILGFTYCCNWVDCKCYPSGQVRGSNSTGTTPPSPRNLGNVSMPQSSPEVTTTTASPPSTITSNPRSTISGASHSSSTLATSGSSHRHSSPITQDELLELDPQRLIDSFGELTDLHKIGSGGFSVVYRAKLHGKDVAAKRLNEDDDNPREARILNSLKHPNIVKLFGIVDEGINFFLIMELCKESLRSYLDKNRGQSLGGLFYHWAKQGANAIKYLHERYITHKDVKSPNYLIADGDVLKLADFGSARKLKRMTTQATDTASHAWMAPELLKENVLSPAYDIYAFGVVTWELWTTNVPFEDAQIHHQIIYRVCNNNERPKIPDDCPQRIKELLTQYWDSDYHKRPHIDEVLKRLHLAEEEFQLADIEEEQML